MRTFRYNQQLETPVNGSLNEVIEKTEADILEEYFCYWAEQMINVGLVDSISAEACIEDWVAVHWAWEVTDVNPKPMTQAELERTGQDIRD